MKKVFVIIIFLICINTLFAQDSTFSFTLQEAKEYALNNNKTLKNASSDVIIAGEKFKEARGVGLPQVSGSMDYMTNFGYEFELDFGMDSEGLPEEIYQMPQFDDGDIIILNILNEMMAPSDGGSAIKMEDQANANLQITQLIYSRQYWIGLQMAKIGKKMAEQSIEVTQADIKESVANTYYLILITKEILKILEENEKNLKDVLKHTEDMFKAGIMEQTDVDQIKMSLTQLEHSKRSTERSMQLNYNLLKFILSIENNTGIELKDDLQTFIEEIEHLEIFNIENDLSGNPTFQLMEMQEELNEKQIVMQKWSYGPTLSGFYSHTEKLLTTAFDLSPKDAAGLTLSIPIYSGGTNKAKLNQAIIELDKTKRNKIMLEEQLQLQEDQLMFDLQSAYENFKIQKENIEVAKRVYNSMYNKYKQGMVSGLDLTQANSNFLQAENNYVSAIMDVLLSKLKLDKLYNNL